MTVLRKPLGSKVACVFVQEHSNGPLPIAVASYCIVWVPKEILLEPNIVVFNECNYIGFCSFLSSHRLFPSPRVWASPGTYHAIPSINLYNLLLVKARHMPQLQKDEPHLDQWVWKYCEGEGPFPGPGYDVCGTQLPNHTSKSEHCHLRCPVL